MHADFEIIAVEDDRVFVVDLNLGSKSVTNDAEYVWEQVQRQYPNRRLIYRDSEGEWNEILGPDISFRPYAATAPKNALVVEFEKNELEELVENLKPHLKNQENRPCQLWAKVGEDMYRLTGGVGNFDSFVVFFAVTTVGFRPYNEHLPNEPESEKNELEKLVENLNPNRLNQKDKPCQLWVKVGEDMYRLTGGVSSFGSHVVFFARRYSLKSVV
jgi:hypothetical protein